MLKWLFIEKYDCHLYNANGDVMSEILIKDQKQIDIFMKKVREDGVKKLHILADFDRTITKSIVDGKLVPSLISILRDENYLTPDYRARAHALYDRFHAIEIDPKVSTEEKKKAMYEWWTTHFKILMECGLNESDLDQVIKSARIQLRDGAREFIVSLDKFQIPMVILSASGLSIEVIKDYLSSINLLYKNIYIISNQFKWDEKGNMVGYLEPVVHSFNKDETLIYESPFYDKIRNRKNVILMGDSIGDLGMIEGFEWENLLKIGFLDEKIDECREVYKENFDAVIVDQGGFGFVNDLLSKIAR